jgi:hypothetical protein
MRIARDQSYPVADRAHGAVLRPAGESPSRPRLANALLSTVYLIRLAAPYLI